MCSPSQWHHVSSKENPEDLARGLSIKEFLKCGPWKNGPAFLWQESENWLAPLQEQNIPDLTEDPEVRKDRVLSCAVNVEQETNFLEELCGKYSNWHKMKRACAWVNSAKNFWLRRASSSKKPLSLDEMHEAERVVFRYLQREHFAKEIAKLEAGSEVPSSSSLSKLDPFLENGLLRVDGRSENSQLSHESNHQIILPECYVSKLIVTEQNQSLGHTGRQQVIAKLREALWIVKVNSLARSVLSKCVKCRKIRGQVLPQKMANLLEERLIADHPPFTFVGVDLFGPLLAKQDW